MLSHVVRGPRHDLQYDLLPCFLNRIRLLEPFFGVLVHAVYALSVWQIFKDHRFGVVVEMRPELPRV